MSSEAQNVIAEVVAKHEFDGVERDRIRDRIIGLCSCGKRVRTHPRSSHAEHVAEEIDKALGGLTREEQWVPVEESGDRWTGRSREAAEANLKVFSVTGICHDPADDSPLVRIEHEARWVSGWSEGVSDRFYVLDCDRCGKTLGWTTNAAFPMCGLTRCTDCMREAIA